jgi:hypothetical protein
MKTETVEGVYLLRGDGQTGPHTLDEVRSLLAQGWYNLQTLAWWEGAPGWVPLSQLPGLAPASSRPAHPRRAPGLPPPPPSQHRAYTYSDNGHDDLSGFWGKVGSAFLVPLIGLVICGAGLGFPKIGALFVFLGCYNAILSVRSCGRVRWMKAVAWLAVAANALYTLMALGMVMAEPGTTNSATKPTQAASRASGKATLAAWQSYNASFSGLSPSYMNSAQLEQVASRLSEIDMRGVDPSLKAHIDQAGVLLADAHRLVAGFEHQLKAIQADTQVGGLALGMLFGAVSADGNTKDPYGDAFRAGVAGGELANEAGNIAVFQLQMTYRPRGDALQAQFTRLGREYERLRSQLAHRYGLEF